MAVQQNRAYRVTFAVEGEGLRLVSAVRLQKVSPPSIPLEGAERESGCWFTLEDGQGRAVYRRGAGGNPFATTREVFTGERQSMRQIDTGRPADSLVLLVPALEGAATLVVSASPGGDPARAAEPVARVGLREIEEIASREGGPHGRV